MRVRASLFDDGSARRALELRKAEDATTVVLEEELQRAATQAAFTVIQEEVSNRCARDLLSSGLAHDLILLNMFTENVKPVRSRGRPPGQTSQGAATRARLYATAIRLIAERGYAATTLREVASEAGVSVGLLYRYFPSKQAIVLALYDELSSEYARQAANMRPGRWRDRFVFALKTSLDVLAPHQAALRALTPVLVGDPDEGIFAAQTAFSRLRVQRVFEQAIAGSTDAPRQPLADALGRLLYLVHLAVLLWWLLDRSPRQRTTRGLVGLLHRVLPSVQMSLHLPLVRGFVASADALFVEGLVGASEK